MSDVQFDEVDFAAQNPLLNTNQKKGSGLGRVLCSFGIGRDGHQADKILVVFIVIAILLAVAIPTVSLYTTNQQVQAPSKSVAETLLEAGRGQAQQNQ
jgi:cell division protein FtsL